jgi:hypothetical protein
MLGQVRVAAQSLGFGFALLLAAWPGAAQAQETSLLLGKAPLRSSGVRRADVLTDGRAAEDGAYWKTRLTAQFDDTAAFVEWDLGKLEQIRGAWLQGDTNDGFRLEGSIDGRSFARLWDAPEAREPGLQSRAAHALDAPARYLRIRPLRGDGKFTLTEVQVFNGPVGSPPSVAAGSYAPLSDHLRDRTLLFGLGLLALLAVPARPRRWLLAIGIGLAALVGARFGLGVWDDWPVDAREVSLIRGMIAFVGALAIAREVFAPARWPASRVLCTSVLALCAALGVAAFYNLGHPQFWNEHRGRWSFSHLLDLRQYYPTAKYFRELGYVGIYDADIAAFAEKRPDSALEALAVQPVRDLQTFRVVEAQERSAQIAATRARFSPERWAAYRADAEWFRRAMGDAQYLDTLIDYGGNATPVWMAIAHVLFSLLAPSETAFTWTGLIDLALILAAFVAIGRTFGLRTMLASALVFGANDFVMYGTNWSGATLRHDWLAYLAFGLCALKRERWRMAGAWLGLATMIRAFPILALVGAAIPAAFRLASDAIRTRRLPRFSELRSEQAILHVAQGALAAAVISAGLSMLILGPSAWSDWWVKVAKLESDPHPASVALRNLIAGSEDQARVLAARWPLYAAVIAMFCGAVAWLGRNVSLERAALLGLCLVPVVFYPANYYLHYVYLLPLWAVEARGPQTGTISKRDASVWLILLAMCAAQYFTTLESDLALHFYFSTVTLFAALTAMLGGLLATDAELRAWLNAPSLAKD